MAHNAKATALAKWSVLTKPKILKNMQKNDSRKTLELFCAKKGSKKTPNTRKVTSFRKSAKLAETVSLVEKLKF